MSPCASQVRAAPGAFRGLSEDSLRPLCEGVRLAATLPQFPLGAKQTFEPKSRASPSHIQVGRATIPYLSPHSRCFFGLGFGGCSPLDFGSGGGARVSGAVSAVAFVVIVWPLSQDHLQKERVRCFGCEVEPPPLKFCFVGTLFFSLDSQGRKGERNIHRHT